MSDELEALDVAREAWIVEDIERIRIEIAHLYADHLLGGGGITLEELRRRNTDHALHREARQRWLKRQRAIPAAVRRDVLSADACAYCGGYAEAVDHIIPVSRGGTADRTNLTASCRQCNEEKLDFTPGEWRAWREETGREWPPRTIDEERREIIERVMRKAELELAEEQQAQSRSQA